MKIICERARTVRPNADGSLVLQIMDTKLRRTRGLGCMQPAGLDETGMQKEGHDSFKMLTD